MQPVLLHAAADAAATALVDAADGPPAAIVALAEGGHSAAAAVGAAALNGDSAGSANLASTAHAHDLASVSKLLTVLALQVLFSRGDLSPDRTLASVLGPAAASHADATLDQVLRHRGGFAPWFPLYLRADAAADPLLAALDVPPEGAAGAAHRYSDLGMQSLGGVLARVTSLPFAEAVRALVLDPLTADSISAGSPLAGSAVLSGQTGDDIEREMVRSGEPYPVEVSDSGFPWRTTVLRGEVGDGNAHHVFGGAAGHAGWFGDVDGVMRIADALAFPELLGLSTESNAALWRELDPGQGSGVRTFTAVWNGRPRRFIGHGGFTGGCVAAAPAIGDAPALRIAILTNRLHCVAAARVRSRPTAEALWHRAVHTANHALHPVENGIRP